MNQITATQAPQVRFRDLVAGGMNGEGAGMGLAEMGGGGFMELILQLMAGTGDGEGGLAGLFGQARDARQDDGQEGVTLASQMLAETLFGALMPQADLLTADGLAQGGAMALTDAQRLALLNQLPEGMTLSQFLQQAARTKESRDAQPFMQAATQAAREEAPAQAIAQAQGGREADEQQLPFGAENQFRSAVQEAQKLLKASKEEQDPAKTAAIDVDRLQHEVDSGRYAPVNAAKDARMPDPKGLADQVKTGILSNLGKNEFVVKLKPDGLGEITVKMVEAGSKISLSILTSNAQVAKMLNGELAGLRESLRPYNADVSEVVSQPDASYAAAQNGQFGQSFAGHQHQQYQQGGGAQEYYWYGGEEAEDAETAESYVDPQSELDTYI